jgi:hypothetical protein
VALVREPSAQDNGMITVSVPSELATAGSGFSFPLPAQIADQGANNAKIKVTYEGGDLPSWLTFNEETKTFVATAVPNRAFPLELVVTIGGRSTTIKISERK